MKTGVVMKRELFGTEISQQSKTAFFSATDLVRAGNAWRIRQGLPPFNMQAWFKNKSTQEFVQELENRFGTVKQSKRGRGQHLWVHPLLFIDMALAISPTLKIEVYSWLFDHLIKNRNDSGDSYKLMCGALFVRSPNKRFFPAYIKTLAARIRDFCEVDDWQHANEQQLKLRDTIHSEIAKLADVLNNNDEAIRLAFMMNNNTKRHYSND